MGILKAASISEGVSTLSNYANNLGCRETLASCERAAGKGQGFY